MLFPSKNELATNKKKKASQMKYIDRIIFFNIIRYMALVHLL